MTLYSYIVPRDYGFAPNPFNGYCTLATCKPRIRKTAGVGDWVIGTTSKCKHGVSGHLIYAMRVSEKITFDDYWNDKRFQVKKPHMNGSLKQAFGDNIYHQVEGKRRKKWSQENSHHSYEGGVINYNNLERDTEFPFVLISNHFFYFGENYIDLPGKLKDLVMSTQGHKSNHNLKLVEKFVKWIEAKHALGMRGNPLRFTSFERYKGTKN